jgi:hypothetical protein
MFSLVSLGAILGMLGMAQAGTSITYDWVTPTGGLSNGADTFHLVGSITVDGTGISATPIDLTAGMVQSWQISVLDSTNTVKFSLTSSTDGLFLTPDVTGGIHPKSAPQITSTSIYLPELPPLIPGQINWISEFEMFRPGLLQVPQVLWSSDLSTNVGSPNTFDAFVAATFADSSVAASSDISTNSELLIATTIPEPASLIIWWLVAGVFGVWRIRKRRRLSATTA